MKIIESVMCENLEIQFKIKAVIELLDKLDSSYSEEKDMKIKAIVYILKVYLEGVYADIDNTIDKIDDLLVSK